jgi:hypothetical protein
MAGWTPAKRHRAAMKAVRTKRREGILREEARKAVATKRRTGVLWTEARKALRTRQRRSGSPYG